MSNYSNHKKDNSNAPQTDPNHGHNTQRDITNVHNIIIVDESGSMCFLAQATVAGINETINAIKKAQEKHADTQRHFLTLVTFDSGNREEWVRAIIKDQPINTVDKFTAYSPCGGTPLYDAIGTTLSTMHRNIMTDANATAVVTIISDGMENTSHEWTASQVVKLIDQLTDEGWTFSYMGSDHDVQSVTTFLHIHNVVEFSHDETGASNTWQRDMSAKMSYFDNLSSDNYRAMSAEQRRQERKRMSGNFYRNRVTPDNITTLTDNEILVFGYHVSSKHTSGLASIATARFGAIPGKTEGPQGSCYAIPTAGTSLRQIQYAVDKFLRYAACHPEKQFLVTAIGCGGAGFTPRAIAPLFRNAISLENVSLPHIFWELLGLRQ